MVRQKYEESKVVEAAYLFFVEKKRQREIATRLGMSQPQISQMIDQARDDGIIKINIQPSQNIKLARRVVERYPHIKSCMVVDYKGGKAKESNELVTNLIGQAAAEHFNSHVLSGGIVGVSGGMTLTTMVNFLNNRSNIENLTIYSMSIWCRSRIDAVSPVAVVSNIIEKYPKSKAYSAQLPDFSLDPAIASQQKRLDLDRLEPILAGPLVEGKNKTLYLGLGSIPTGQNDNVRDTRERPIVDFANLLDDLKVPSKFLELMAGECCLQPYGLKGNILTSEGCSDKGLKNSLRQIENNVIGFDLKKLCEMVETGADIICAVSGGFYKKKSVLGGLRAKIFNHLITDITCAEYVLSDFENND